MDIKDVIVVCLAVAALAISIITIIFDIIFFRLQMNIARTTMKDDLQIVEQIKTLLNEIKINQNVTGQQVKDQYDKLLDAAIHGNVNTSSEAASSAVALQQLNERIITLEKSLVKIKSSEQMNSEVANIKESLTNLNKIVGRFASGLAVEEKRSLQSPLGRFSQDAAFALMDARHIATSYHSEEIEVEHLLLAILNNRNNRASKAILSLNVNIDNIIEATKVLIPKGSNIGEAEELSEGVKKVISLTLEEERKFQLKLVDTEYLLLGIILQNGAPSSVLKSYGLNVDNIYQAVKIL
jgi:hypothetical protein